MLQYKALYIVKNIYALTYLYFDQHRAEITEDNFKSGLMSRFYKF